MKTRTTHDGIIESVYDVDDLDRTDRTEPTTQTVENATYSPATMKAFRRAKKAGVVNDARSRKIVATPRLKREGIAETIIKTTRQSALNF